jgi:hypothetical protein
MYYFGQKMSWATIWATIFSPTNPVTLHRSNHIECPMFQIGSRNIFFSAQELSIIRPSSLCVHLLPVCSLLIKNGVARWIIFIFGYILEGLVRVNVGIFYDHLVYFMV